MVAMAQIAGRLEEPAGDQMIEQMVRWQRDVRDRLRDLDASLTAFVDEAGVAIPDLTVLSVEPVARTESSGFGWRDDPIRHTRS